MTGLSIYLAAVVVSSGLGAPLAMGLLGHRRSAWLLAPTLGYSALAVATTLLYRAGLPMHLISAIAACLAAIGGMWTIWHHRNDLRIARQASLLWGLLIVGVAAWAWLPLLTGGQQFSVFQGNHWDHFNYTTAGVLYARMDYAQVVGASGADLLANPLLPFAAMSIDARPAVMLLFAVFGRMAPAYEMYLSGHAFESAFVIAEFMAALYVLLNLCNVATRRDYALALAAAATFAFGFWGQYILDVNAWSQQAAVAPLLVAFACIAIPLRPRMIATVRERLPGSRPREATALALAATGALYLYPEGAFFFGAMVVAFLCYIGLVERRVDLRAALLPIGLAAVAALFVGALSYDAIYSFLQSQAGIATADPVNWWKYFQAYLFGRDFLPLGIGARDLAAQLQGGVSAGAVLRVIGEIPLGAVALVCANMIAGAFGLYFLTPAHASNIIPVLVLCVFVLAFACALVIGTWRLGAASAFGDLAIFAVAGIVGALVFVGAGRFWVAGKALSFAAPYLCLALGAGMIASMQARRKQWYVAISIGIWMIAQLGFAATRPLAAASETGVHRDRPYPANQDLTFKSEYRWDIAALLEQTAGCNLIHLDIPFAWMRHYVALAVYERGQRYWHQFPVNTYYGSGRDLGNMAIPPAGADCVVAVVNRRVQLVSGPPMAQ